MALAVAAQQSGMLLPEQLVFGPGVGTVAALLERFLNQRSIARELEDPIRVLL